MVKEYLVVPRLENPVFGMMFTKSLSIGSSASINLLQFTQLVNYDSLMSAIETLSLDISSSALSSFGGSSLMALVLVLLG